MDKNLVLDGESVRLEPLGPHHLPALRTCANDAALWEFTFSPSPFTNEADAQQWLTQAREAPDEVAFAVIDKRTGALAGSTRFMDIVADYRKLEIGWTFLFTPYWRTRMNTEMKLLMLRHAFEEWKALRVQLKAEAVNQRSRAAILRLGATYEGTLRNFRIRPSDGSVRSVSFYSVIDEEWPAVEQRLLTLLDRSLCSPASE